MADRAWVITFDGEKARVALPPKNSLRVRSVQADGRPAKIQENYIFTYTKTGLTEYRVRAPSAQRAEQIARAMRKPK